jgi:hypothetical protein
LKLGERGSKIVRHPLTPPLPLAGERSKKGEEEELRLGERDRRQCVRSKAVRQEDEDKGSLFFMFLSPARGRG